MTLRAHPSARADAQASRPLARVCAVTVWALALCGLAAGAAIDVRERAGPGGTQIVVTTGHYRAVVDPAHGAHIAVLQHRADEAPLGSFALDFDPRVGPPHGATMAYRAHKVTRNEREVFIVCSARLNHAGPLQGSAWHKIFAFRADSPAIRVVADVIPGEAKHLGLATRATVPLIVPGGRGQVLFVHGKEANRAFASGRRSEPLDEWVGPITGCTVGAVHTPTASAVAVVVHEPEAEFVRCQWGRGAPAAHIDIGFPVRATGPGQRYRVAWSLVPLQKAASVSAALQQLARLDLDDEAPLAVDYKGWPVSAPRPEPRQDAFRMLIAAAPDRRGLYGIEAAIAEAPFPVECTRVDVVRSTYRRGGNEFFVGLPASLEDMTTYSAAIFCDVPGWAFTPGDGQRLKDYVQLGGNVVFVGDQARGYRGTVVGDLVPLTIPYPRTAAVDSEGREYMKDKSPWLPLALRGDHPILRGLPRNGVLKVVVHQAAPAGSAQVLAMAKQLPALVIKATGRGQVVSMPISVSSQQYGDSSLATDLLAKTAALDGSLIRWPFYDDLWRQMLLCFRGQSPPVHLSGLSAPDECVITVPRRISMEYEIGNVSKQRADMAVHVDFTRNGLPVPNLHSEAQFKVSPGQNVGQQTKTTLDAARGAYEYVVSLRDAKGQVLDARDGTFLALPETFLTIDLFALHGFASDHAIPIRIFVSNINQAKRLVVKADVRDQGGRPIAAMKDTLLENPSLAKMAIEQEIAPHQLRPATYALHATLYGGKKLADKLDAATATFTVHSPLPSSRFPIFLDGIDPGDDAHASAQWDRAKALGVSGVVLTPHTGPCAALRTLADERRLAMLRAAQDRDLAVIDGSGQAADAFRIGCAPSVAADGLPAAVVQALRDYEAQARLMHNLAGVSVTPRRVPTSPAVSDACRGLFRQKFGYDMPGPEVPDRYYYARRFLGDASGGIVDRIRSGLQSEGHALPIAAVIDPQTYFAGMHDPVHFVPAFDVVALAAQSPARIERLWLDMLAAPSIRGKADVWACVHIAPGPGTSWTPRTASAQAYQALGRGAAGLVLSGLRVGASRLTELPSPLAAVRQTLSDMKRLGPLLSGLDPVRAEAGMLYPWASFVLQGSPDVVGRLADTRDMLQATFGAVTVLHENALTNAKALSGVQVLVIAHTSCVPEPLEQVVTAWVKAGGALAALGQVAAIDERSRESRFAERVLGVGFGKPVWAAVSGLSDEPRTGHVLDLLGAKPIYPYAAGGAAVTAHSLGKGRVLTFGFQPQPAELRRVLRTRPTRVLAKSRHPQVDCFTLSDGKSRALYIVAALRENGCWDQGGNPVTIELPHTSWRPFAYDMLDGRPMAVAQNMDLRTVSLNMDQRAGRVIGLLPSRPSALRLDASVKEFTLTYALQVLDGTGAAVTARLPVEIEVKGPDGNVMPAYGGSTAIVAGSLQRSLRLPVTSAKGRWTCRATVRVGALSQEQSFDLK